MIEKPACRVGEPQPTAERRIHGSDSSHGIFHWNRPVWNIEHRSRSCHSIFTRRRPFKEAHCVPRIAIQGRLSFPCIKVDAVVLIWMVTVAMSFSENTWSPLWSFASDVEAQSVLKSRIQTLELQRELLPDGPAIERELLQAKAELNAVEARISYCFYLTGVLDLRNAKGFDWSNADAFLASLWQLACTLAKCAKYRNSAEPSVGFIFETACQTAIRKRNWKFFQQFEHALRNEVSPGSRTDKRKEFLLRYWAIPGSMYQLYRMSDSQIARLLNGHLRFHLSAKEVKQFCKTLGLKRPSITV